MLCYCWRPLVNRIKRKCSTESLLCRIFKSVSPMPGTYRRADCFRIRADSGVLWVSVVSDARNGTGTSSIHRLRCTDTGRIYDTTPARPSAPMYGTPYSEKHFSDASERYTCIAVRRVSPEEKSQLHKILPFPSPFLCIQVQKRSSEQSMVIAKVSR